MPPAGLTEHWTARLSHLANRYRVPGATLGIWAGGREVLAAHGVLSNATRVATTPDSLFQIGSITKVWTATMIMQLAAEGRLTLDTPVAGILPGVRVGRPDGSAEITVRHLLTHTSGLEGDIFADTGRGADCVQRYVAGLGRAARVFPPGAAYSYCNSGFTLLGRIIEVLDRREWDASLRQRLTGPLGLAQTVTLPEEALPHRAATGHRGFPHEGEPVGIWGLPRSSGPAGLITASASDLLGFAMLHLDGGRTPDGARLLDEPLVTAMQQAQVEIPAMTGSDEAVGLAWRLAWWDGQLVIGHDGGTIGQTAHLRIAPGAGVAACLLTNAADSDELYRELFAEVFGEFAGITPPPGPRPADGPVTADLGRHAGRYERASHRFEVSAQDGRLRLDSSLTGTLEELAGAEPEQITLYPADATGDHFVGRSRDEDPWSPVVFGRLGDGTRYLYAHGRITPRVPADASAPPAVVEVRPFRAADRDAVMALAPRLTEGVAPWRDSGAVLAAVRGWVSDSAHRAGEAGHACYVAEADGQVVGLVSVAEQAYWTGDTDAYVGELVVSPGWEGRGLATRLMAAAERWAAGRGLRFITLETGAANAAARGLYASLGFGEESVRLTKPALAEREQAEQAQAEQEQAEREQAAREQDAGRERQAQAGEPG